MRIYLSACSPYYHLGAADHFQTFLGLSFSGDIIWDNRQIIAISPCKGCQILITEREPW